MALSCLDGSNSRIQERNTTEMAVIQCY